ncbi:MAG: O-antigen ligase domain-containing protein [Acidobacteria bacterium]|nr:MAG: O-antigen ligase domain-containing protein [Acidobacteriota bacterium]
MSPVLTSLLAWGVLSFGAVYPWGYGTLAAGVAICALWTARQAALGRPGVVLSSLGLLILACAAQIIALPRGTLEQLSPHISQFLSGVDIAYASGAVNRHALSIDPSQTILALGFIFFGFAWAWVCASVARRTGGFTRALARNIVALGLLVAVIGLAQKATFNGKLLWFWEPMSYATNAFGPFVNRNHFAGWMILALMLSVGYLFGRFSSRAASRESTWRDHLLWIGSPEGTPIILTAVAIAVMACSLLWTMSRSGIAGAGAAVTILTAAAVYRSNRRTMRVALAGYLLLTVAGLVAWRGTDTLFAWYGNTGTLEWRFDLWKDTLPALEDFWMTGSGLNTYDTLMLGYPRTHMTQMPREAHNDYLQLAVEGGLLVCIPVLLLILSVGRTIVRRLKQPQDEMTWWIRMGAAAGICGIAVQELTEFSLQIPGVALLFATCVALAVHEPVPVQSRRRNRTARETSPELAA